MTISNHNNIYVKVISQYISDVIDNISGYSAINIKGRINCCADLFSSTVDLTLGQWHLNLDDAVKSEATLENIYVRNIISLKLFGILSNIDLSYINNNCSVASCTLQTFSGHFSPIFKEIIDEWFTSRGIISNVEITFIGNNLIVDGIPENFLAYSGTYLNKEEIFTYKGTDDKFFLDPTGLYIKPELFELDTLVDGIYTFDIKITRPNGSSTTEINCVFIDINTKCTVATLLVNIKEESDEVGSEQCASIVHLLHYGLVNGSNCGCNCEDLCKVYKELYGLINNIDPLIINNCGC